ncbi:MAG: Uma2 family endonuclease [Gemmataceae bacterium]|nr:Uma2 family endonuclease [Gemmataceae bacterium]
MPKTLTERQVTFDDFCFLVKDKQKADLIDGVIYMASPESIDGHRLFQWLYTLLVDYVEEKNLGEVFGSRVAFRLEERQAPEPDVAFVDKSRLDGARKGFFDGPPDLAIEIVSPDSIERDYVKKKAQYEEHGVREYWIVDELDEIVTLYRLSKKGKYQEVRPKDGIYHSEVIEGFWLDPTWLWQSPRPRKSGVLAKLLQSIE